jgi:hypothetical protein
MKREAEVSDRRMKTREASLRRNSAGADLTRLDTACALGLPQSRAPDSQGIGRVLSGGVRSDDGSSRERKRSGNDPVGNDRLDSLRSENGGEVLDHVKRRKED